MLSVFKLSKALCVFAYPSPPLPPLTQGFTSLLGNFITHFTFTFKLTKRGNYPTFG